MSEGTQEGADAANCFCMCFIFVTISSSPLWITEVEMKLTENVRFKSIWVISDSREHMKAGLVLQGKLARNYIPNPYREATTTVFFPL